MIISSQTHIQYKEEAAHKGKHEPDPLVPCGPWFNFSHHTQATYTNNRRHIQRVILLQNVCLHNIQCKDYSRLETASYAPGTITNLTFHCL